MKFFFEVFASVCGISAAVMVERQSHHNFADTRRLVIAAILAVLSIMTALVAHCLGED